MAKLLVRLPRDRKNVGTISLISNSGIEIILLSALGKAANNTAEIKGNRGASSLLPYGDTPIGVYTIIDIVNAGAGTRYSDTRKYGNTKVIILDPKDGEALLAKNNGRTGILVHGGDPGPGTLLRRTNGCIRMMNDEIQELINKMIDLKIEKGEDTNELIVEEEDPINIVNSDSDDNVNEGDPPPLQ